METKHDNLNPQESLELIANMINQVKGNMQSSSFYFLLWGWVIAICNFSMYAIFKYSTFKAYAPYVWILIVPAWIITVIYANKQQKQKGATTHLDEINKWLWITMSITIVPVWFFGDKLNWMINAIVMMPIGSATFLSGIIIRFKPLIYGGITFWLAGIACYFFQPLEQVLIGGLAVMLGYLVPGYLLKKSNQ
jgi:hypothetical protein